MTESSIYNGIPVFLTTCDTLEETQEEINELLVHKFFNYILTNNFPQLLNQFNKHLTDIEADVLYNLKVRGLSSLIINKYSTKNDRERIFSFISNIGKKIVLRKGLEFNKFVLLHDNTFHYKNIKDDINWLFDVRLNKFIKYDISGIQNICACDHCSNSNNNDK